MLYVDEAILEAVERAQHLRVMVSFCFVKTPCIESRRLRDPCYTDVSIWRRDGGAIMRADRVGLRRDDRGMRACRNCDWRLQKGNWVRTWSLVRLNSATEISNSPVAGVFFLGTMVGGVVWGEVEDALTGGRLKREGAGRAEER